MTGASTRRRVKCEERVNRAKSLDSRGLGARRAAGLPDPRSVEALRAELSEKQRIELTAAVAFENDLARFNRGFKIEALGLSEGATCSLPDHHRRLDGSNSQKTMKSIT